jgi:hypothetical protein
VRTPKVRIGTRVRVSPSYRKPGLRGAVGVVKKVWGSPHYAVVEVWLDDGRSELLWRHEVEEVREEAMEGVFTRLRWG